MFGNILSAYASSYPSGEKSQTQKYGIGGSDQFTGVASCEFTLIVLSILYANGPVLKARHKIS